MRLVLTLTAMLLVMPVSASLLEDQGVSYQFDGDTHHDAPDVCQEADPAWQLRPDNRTDGMLVPGDDESDHFVFNTTAQDIGKRHTISLQETSTHAADIKAELDVLNADCVSVFDVMRAPMAGPGERTVEAQSLEGDKKCTDRWFFVVTGVNLTTAPDFVRVMWTDGYIEDVPMDSVPPEPVGQYQTTSRLDTTIRHAWAVVDQNWTGSFRLGEASCGAQDGGWAPPVRVGDTIEFSVVGSGQFIIGVHLDQVEVNDPTRPVPLTCHMCFSEVEELMEAISYVLKSDQEDAH